MQPREQPTKNLAFGEQKPASKDQCRRPRTSEVAVYHRPVTSACISFFCGIAGSAARDDALSGEAKLTRRSQHPLTCCFKWPESSKVQGRLPGAFAIDELAVFAMAISFFHRACCSDPQKVDCFSAIAAHFTAECNAMRCADYNELGSPK